MFWMSRRKLRKLVDEARVQQAIESAERMTSGEICVSVAPLVLGNVRRKAERAFVRLGMVATRQRNGVLFFIVPSRRTFVILGDAGIHAQVGDEFWQRVAGIVGERFRTGEFTEGLVEGIEEVGRLLAKHFPHEGERDVNELGNGVDFAE